jgi:hypothetical protein
MVASLSGGVTLASVAKSMPDVSSGVGMKGWIVGRGLVSWHPTYMSAWHRGGVDSYGLCNRDIGDAEGGSCLLIWLPAA